MSRMLKCACPIVLYLILGPGVALSGPIYLTCTGKRTEYAGSLPGASRSDAKITRDVDVTTTVKLDVDAQTFGWSEVPAALSWPHCNFLANGQMDPTESRCTYVFYNEVIFVFGIELLHDADVGAIGGTIDRATGTLSAGQNTSKTSYTRWQMVCSPASQKF